MGELKDIIPKNTVAIAIISAIIPSAVYALLVYCFINVTFEYGVTIFILIPFFTGFTSVILRSVHEKITFKKAARTTNLSIFFLGLFLILFHIEGLICVIMAAPLGILFAYIGAYIAYVIRKKNQNNLISILFIGQLFLLPSFSFVESKYEKINEVYAVSTSVIVDAPKQTVWNNLVAFKTIPPPNELIFNYGISYPVNSEVQGEGVGAIRYCNFSTGSFVEPVDVWDEPNLLHFYVEEQPVPMTELTPYGELDAAHLHGYFVSTKGQFKLTTLADGKTKLEGTTWYYNKIYPQFYWSLWTDYIIHSIHSRVLNHIKKTSERK